MNIKVVGKWEIKVTHHPWGEMPLNWRHVLVQIETPQGTFLVNQEGETETMRPLPGYKFTPCSAPQIALYESNQEGSRYNGQRTFKVLDE